MLHKSTDTVEERSHITLKALTTVSTDEGTFEAVISTASIDRENDVVVPAAMVKALRAWIQVGKMVPFAWGHQPEDVVGHIDPSSVKAVGDEVVGTGWVDQSIERGAHTWRLVKSGTLGFSFGYMIVKSVKRADGVREIQELDVFEVSATATPMNHDTRVLGWKSALEEQLQGELVEVKARLDTLEKALEDQKSKTEVTDKEPGARSVDPLRKHAREAAQEILRGGVGVKPPQDTEEPRAPEMNPAELREYSRAQIVQILSGGIAS